MSAANDMSPRRPDDLVRLPEVLHRTGLSRPTIYRRMRGGTFPRQEAMSFNCVAWREADLSAWLADPMGWRAQEAA